MIPMEKRPSWIYNQSGVIPFRFAQGRLSVLLITSRNCKHWIIPKGIIEIGLSPADSAEKEAFEEAGIRGILYPNPIGEYQYDKWNGTCNVQVFLLEVEDVLEDWPEADFRIRRWTSVEEAERLIDVKPLRKILQELPSNIARIEIKIQKDTNHK